MTDLAARIADVKQKAEETARLMEIESFSKGDRWPTAYKIFQQSVSPDLFLAMAARIEELGKALEPFAEVYERNWKAKDTDQLFYGYTTDQFEITHLPPPPPAP
jgi:hypothetical protein